MPKPIVLFCSLWLFACAQRSSTPANGQNPSTAANANWSKEREMLFLSGCIENAKLRYSDTAAYALCNCMLNQVKTNYPDADSATLMQNLQDTAVVLKMTQNCQ